MKLIYCCTLTVLLFKRIHKCIHRPTWLHFWSLCLRHTQTQTVIYLLDFSPKSFDPQPLTEMSHSPSELLKMKKYSSSLIHFGMHSEANIVNRNVIKNCSQLSCMSSVSLDSPQIFQNYWRPLQSFCHSEQQRQSNRITWHS